MFSQHQIRIFFNFFPKKRSPDLSCIPIKIKMTKPALFLSMSLKIRYDLVPIFSVCESHNKTTTFFRFRRALWDLQVEKDKVDQEESRWVISDPSHGLSEARRRQTQHSVEQRDRHGHKVAQVVSLAALPHQFSHSIFFFFLHRRASQVNQDHQENPDSLGLQWVICSCCT